MAPRKVGTRERAVDWSKVEAAGREILELRAAHAGHVSTRDHERWEARAERRRQRSQRLRENYPWPRWHQPDGLFGTPWSFALKHPVTRIRLRLGRMSLAIRRAYRRLREPKLLPPPARGPYR